MTYRRSFFQSAESGEIMISVQFNEMARADIPWHRLTTAYGRGTDLPQLMDAGQYEQIANLIEHQSTLWQVTPWVLLFLLRDLKKKQPQEVASGEIDLFDAVADALFGRDAESLQHVPNMALLLDEQYLWPEDDQEDELLWEEEEPQGYEELPFSSYYYYSYLLLKEAVPYFKKIKQSNQNIFSAISGLIEKID